MNGLELYPQKMFPQKVQELEPYFSDLVRAECKTRPLPQRVSPALGLVIMDN